MKTWFQNSSKYCSKTIPHFQIKHAHPFVQQSVGNVCAEFKVVFVLEPMNCLPLRNLSLPKFLYENFVWFLLYYVLHLFSSDCFTPFTGLRPDKFSIWIYEFFKDHPRRRVLQRNLRTNRAREITFRASGGAIFKNFPTWCQPYGSIFVSLKYVLVNPKTIPHFLLLACCLLHFSENFLMAIVIIKQGKYFLFNSHNPNFWTVWESK